MVNSTSCADRLERIVREAYPVLVALDGPATAERAGRAWAPVELLGHLIDSASNNHVRFVRAQSAAQPAESLVFPGYDQDEWVALQRYADAPWLDLVELWRLFNLQLARVMRAASVAARERPRAEHNLDKIAWRSVPRREATTLEYLMADYVDHLQHHLGQLRASS